MSKKPYIISLFSFLLLRSTIAARYEVVNSVPNSPGGFRFNYEIGAFFTLKTMKTINSFIWETFKQYNDTEQKKVPLLTVNITILNDGALGEIGGDNIYIDSVGIQYFPSGQAKYWFTSLMYHEMTHIFQWSGQGTAPGGLTEGIADYVMIKSNYYDPSSYTKFGEGDKWDEGYGVTARFLEYCDSLRDGFTAELNNKMRVVYKDMYFEDLLGKSLEQVWSEYKAKYGSNISTSDNWGGHVFKDLKY